MPTHHDIMSQTWIRLATFDNMRWIFSILGNVHSLKWARLHLGKSTYWNFADIGRDWSRCFLFDFWRHSAAPQIKQVTMFKSAQRKQCYFVSSRLSVLLKLSFIVWLLQWVGNLVQLVAGDGAWLGDKTTSFLSLYHINVIIWERIRLSSINQLLFISA